MRKRENNVYLKYRRRNNNQSSTTNPIELREGESAGQRFIENMLEFCSEQWLQWDDSDMIAHVAEMKKVIVTRIKRGDA